MKTIKIFIELVGKTIEKINGKRTSVASILKDL
jgi:hypothetical protein